MTRFKVGVTALGLVVGMLFGGPAIAWKRGAVQVLAVLPHATGSVEGIAVEAERRNVNVAVGSYRKSFDAALDARRDIRHYRQHFYSAALPRNRRPAKQHSNHEAKRRHADFEPSHDYLPAVILNSWNH